MLGAATRRPAATAGTILPIGLDQALHRCIVLASRFGTISLGRPDDPNTREFVLEPGGAGDPRLRWTLKRVGAGTELTIAGPSAVARLTHLGRRGAAVDMQLGRRLQLLPHIVSLKIAVVGGGTGIYTTLLGLRDRTWSLTAVISGLPRGTGARDPKDHLGSLPRDDAGLCLVALTPSIEENMVLRSLLAHRMEGREWRGAHFGTALLEALEEVRGSRQAALDTAVELLGIRGRVVLALDDAGRGDEPGVRPRGALAALAQADLIVIAPGHLEFDLLPVLSCPGVRGAIREGQALKVVVTNIMTAEGSSERPVTSDHIRALAAVTGSRFGVVLANAAALSPRQRHAYAAAGAHPVVPDVEATLNHAARILTEQLAARGDLARHDPEALGECLVQSGADHLLSLSEESLQEVPA